MVKDSLSDPNSRRTTYVGKHQTTLFLTRLLETHFEDLPSAGSHAGIDEARWLFEWVVDGSYHVVDRGNPGLPEAAYVVGATLVEDDTPTA